MNVLRWLIPLLTGSVLVAALHSEALCSGYWPCQASRTLVRSVDGGFRWLSNTSRERGEDMRRKVELIRQARGEAVPGR